MHAHLLLESVALLGDLDRARRLLHETLDLLLHRHVLIPDDAEVGECGLEVALGCEEVGAEALDLVDALTHLLFETRRLTRFDLKFFERVIEQLLAPLDLGGMCVRLRLRLVGTLRVCVGTLRVCARLGLGLLEALLALVEQALGHRERLLDAGRFQLLCANLLAQLLNLLVRLL